MRYLKWLLDRFAGRRAGQVVIAVALLLALPSLLSPLSMDEHVQAIRWRAAMEHPEGGGVTGFLNDCFVFASGDEMANRREIQDGLGAWWPARRSSTLFPLDDPFRPSRAAPILPRRYHGTARKPCNLAGDANAYREVWNVATRSSASREARPTPVRAPNSGSPP
jgi:hypothetical protein